MCGIAGIIALDSFDPKMLLAMTNLVSYRGPSGFGFAFSRGGLDEPLEVIHDQDHLPATRQPQIGLGNRRLAILDLSPRGNQPMTIEDGKYCITFNGEIYNYLEIREELKTCGHKFETRTDTEVILRAYQQWGEDCLKRFNGMWSFALWDQPQQRLFCARDRFGVKPFYYCRSDLRFYCGSELKQLTRALGARPAANPRAVYRFLEFGELDSSAETLFQGISQLPGGHCLRLKVRQGLPCEIRRYWDLSLAPESDLNKNEATEKFHSLFTEAVRIRLRSDVPIGSCLSGGLDSSSIVCKVSRLSPQTVVHTFSACFEESPLDERKFISAITSSVLGAEHWTYPKADEFWKDVSAVLWHQDEPVASSNVFAQWCVMREAKRHDVPVLLDGQGADEILCGYQKYRYFYLWHLFRRGDPKFLREAMLSLPHGTRSFFSLDEASRYFPKIARRPFSVVQRIGTPELRRVTGESDSPFGPGESVSARQKTDLNRTSLPALLHYLDRNSMAHAVEVRNPFLDYRLVEFAINSRPEIKLGDGWNKWVLRSAMKGTLPEVVRRRRTKLGFDTPQEDWMRHGLTNGHRETFTGARLRMERFLSAPSLAREIHAFLSQQPAGLPSGGLFRALSLEMWAQTFGVS